MKGQITLEEYKKQLEQPTYGCNCICENCLYWWSSRCPYGECYDDYRAITDPYDQAHQENVPRKPWSDWDKPGQQRHWCRGGMFYPTNHCKHFKKYNGAEIEDCAGGPIQIFQDGYIKCLLKDKIGCEECIARKEGKEREKIYGCSWMTETGCDAHINALSLMAHMILEEDLEQEMCKEQCCIGCNKICGFRCNSCR